MQICVGEKKFKSGIAILIKFQMTHGRTDKPTVISSVFSDKRKFFSVYVISIFYQDICRPITSASILKSRHLTEVDNDSF